VFALAWGHYYNIVSNECGIVHNDMLIFMALTSKECHNLNTLTNLGEFSSSYEILGVYGVFPIANIFPHIFRLCSYNDEVVL